MHATAYTAPVAAIEDRTFYVWMAGVFLLIAFSGFVPTYWAPLLAQRFHAPPVVHIHGMLLFTWTLFYFVQTTLVAAGRIRDHRAWGLAGIALFSVVLCTILVVLNVSIKQGDAMGQGDAARRFAAVPFCGALFAAVMFATAIANVRRPAIHKRLMTVLMIGMMMPALARLVGFLLAPAGVFHAGPPPPVALIRPALVTDLLIAVVMVRDWRVLGRPHPAYLIAGSALVSEQMLAIGFAGTQTWMGIAHWFEGLAG